VHRRFEKEGLSRTICLRTVLKHKPYTFVKEGCLPTAMQDHATAGINYKLDYQRLDGSLVEMLHILHEGKCLRLNCAHVRFRHKAWRARIGT
jgi:hypothetical protein